MERVVLGAAGGLRAAAFTGYANFLLRASPEMFTRAGRRTEPKRRRLNRHSDRPAARCPPKPKVKFKQFPEYLALEARNIASGKWAA